MDRSRPYMSPRKYMVLRIKCSITDSGSPVSSSVSGTCGKTVSFFWLDSRVIMETWPRPNVRRALPLGGFGVDFGDCRKQLDQILRIRHSYLSLTRRTNGTWYRS